ncbi:MAG: ParB/RepB/Spo0J family partition protein [Firmicutes bacterium]|nr:ParB/RepB/Spo0J family partition protein [Bacillota bacterium]
MEQKRNIAIPKFNVDDYFTTQEERDDAIKEKVDNLDISILKSFKNHPFKVLNNDELKKLVISIKDNGILEPVIVRPSGESYEIISGHRRKKASEILGLKSIPCIIRDMSDDEATIYMVDSNMHREQLLPSEKAFAFKMKLNALKHQGDRTDLTSSPLATKLDSASQIGLESGESRDNVYRYIRLTYLIPELLEMVDNSVVKDKNKFEIALRPAVELSYLNEGQQKHLLNIIESTVCTPSHDQAIRIKKLTESGKFSVAAISNIMNEEKPNQITKIKIQENKIRDIIPKSVKVENMETFIIKSVEHYVKYLKDRNRDER